MCVLSLASCQTWYSAMNKIIRTGNKTIVSEYVRSFSVSAANNANHSCKLLVIGGGTGGCTIATKFARLLKKHEVIVLEPSPVHYYQPLWTLVGAGVTSVAATRRNTRNLLPTKATWIQDHAKSVNPEKNLVVTREGHEICYEYLVVATGLNINYDKVPGLKAALDDPCSRVSTIFSPDYCEKTYRDLQSFTAGDAVFTYPDTPIKCPGAPQKIVYLADAYLRKTNKRDKANISFNTALPVIFGVPKYAASLLKVVAKKGINVNFSNVLKSVDHEKKQATFSKVSNGKKETCTIPYHLLHVAPPLQAASFLRDSRALTDASAFLEVDKFTLQHVRYPNIFGIGDCTNTPNSKIAAAVAKQSYVVEQNLLSVMSKGQAKQKYTGYGACPLVTSFGTCIMAEFLYDGVVHETFPWDQSKESRLAYYMKRDLFPFIYWNFMLKGRYHGPEFVRKIVNPLGW